MVVTNHADRWESGEKSERCAKNNESMQMAGAYVIGCRGSFCFYSLLISLVLFDIGSTIWLWNRDFAICVFFLLCFFYHFKVCTKRSNHCNMPGTFNFQIIHINYWKRSERKKNWFNNKRYTRCWTTFVRSTQCMRPMHKKSTTTTSTMTMNITEKEKKRRSSLMITYDLN